MRWRPRWGWRFRAIDGTSCWVVTDVPYVDDSRQDYDLEALRLERCLARRAPLDVDGERIV
jgi:hypothetical protein